MRGSCGGHPDQNEDNDRKAFQIDVDNHWLASDSWELPVHEVADHPPGTTESI